MKGLPPMAGRASWAGLAFRLGRVALLVLLVVMPWEGVTAARECALILAAAGLALGLGLTPGRHWRPTVLFFPWLCYLAAALLSLVWAVDPGYSLHELRGEVLKGMLVYYLAAHFIWDEAHLRQAWSALLVGVALMGAFGVFFFWYFEGSLLHHQVRAGSLHNGYGGLGTYLTLVWPLVLLAPRGLGRPVWRPWLLALAGLTAVVAYLTFNRAAWLGLLLETGLCRLVFARHRLRAVLLGGGLTLLLGAALLWLVPGATHGERWSELGRDPAKVGGTAGDLFAVWRHSLGAIAEHPLKGIGLGRHSFAKAFPEFRMQHQPLLWHSHNMFIELALQMGVQGLLAVLLMMILLGLWLWPRCPPPPGDLVGHFQAAVAVMLAGFALRNLTDDFFVKDSALLFWLLAGLALGAQAWRREAAAGA